MTNKKEKPVILTGLVVLALSLSSVEAANTGAGLAPNAATTDDIAFERLKKQIRDASVTNPAEGEAAIKRMEGERAQLKQVKEHPEEIEKELVALVERMKGLKAPDKRLEFSEARTALERKLEWYVHNKVAIPASIGNKISDEVLSVYGDRAGGGSADSLPITVAARIANSSASKKYLLEVLNGSSEEDRLHLLIELAWSQNLRGDKEIFDALAKRREFDDKNSGALLGAMSRLDRQRALPIVIGEINTTKDIKRFTQDSDILSEYGRVELLEHPLARIKDFPNVGLVSKQNPTLGIDPALLLKYIEKADGPKLDSALIALEQSIEALQNCEPVIMAKLRSAKPGTRRHAAEFLRRMRETPLIRSSANLDEIRRLKLRESDKTTRDALEAAISGPRNIKRK